MVHTVGVGTEAGQPVPEIDNEGRRTGYKRDATGTAVVSRWIRRRPRRPSPGERGASSSESRRPTRASASLATAIDTMDRRSLATEYSYRRKERFQIPLAAALACFAAALAMPLPGLRRRRVPRRGRGSPLPPGHVADDSRRGRQRAAMGATAPDSPSAGRRAPFGASRLTFSRRGPVRLPGPRHRSPRPVRRNRHYPSGAVR